MIGAHSPRSLGKRLVFASIPLLVLLAALEVMVRVLKLDQDCPASTARARSGPAIRS